MKEDGSGCLDTVGAVVVDLEGNVAAAVSSGGLAMKHPGRVGQVGLSQYNNAHFCVTASFCQLMGEYLNSRFYFSDCEYPVV